MKNEFEVRGDETVIFVNGPTFGLIETTISTSCLDEVIAFPNKWYAKRFGSMVYICGHAPRNGKERDTTLLHRLVTKAPKGMLVDHQDNNTFNNTLDNLRIVTNAQNMQNLKGSRSSSGVRGVTWNRSAGKWQARITINGKLTHLGFFGTIEEADCVVSKARSLYMPFSKEAAQ